MERRGEASRHPLVYNARHVQIVEMVGDTCTQTVALPVASVVEGMTGSRDEKQPDVERVCLLLSQEADARCCTSAPIFLITDFLLLRQWSVSRDEVAVRSTVLI